MTAIDDPFVKYYEEASTNAETVARFRAVFDLIVRVRGELSGEQRPLDLADIGCGAGTQSLMWADAGHRAHGIDINEALVEIAKSRAKGHVGNLEFVTGTAAALPWRDNSMDVCLLPELLEHVPQWQVCLDECLRILRPGGILYVSTANYLCPKQMEFDLPLYSWYPQSLKRYFERRAVTDWPELVNHAKYPAVNWFSFYSLRRYLRPKGFDCRDRFDVMQVAGKSAPAAAAVRLVRSLPPLRWLGQLATPYAMVLAVKR